MLTTKAGKGKNSNSRRRESREKSSDLCKRNAVGCARFGWLPWNKPELSAAGEWPGLCNRPGRLIKRASFMAATICSGLLSVSVWAWPELRGGREMGDAGGGGVDGSLWGRKGGDVH